MNFFTKIIISTLLLSAVYGVGSYVVNGDLGVKTASASFTTSGCGNCGGDESDNNDPPAPGNTTGEENNNNYTPPAPICNGLSSNKSTVVAGETFTLSWSTANVGSASLNQGIGSVSVTGSYTVTAPSAPGNYGYILNFDGNTSAACQTTVVITAPPATPTCDAFNIAESTVTPGASITLDWDTTGVTSTSINQGVGSVSVDGPKTVTAPTTPGTYTYALTFDGQTSASCQDTVTVQTTTGSAPRCDFFTASDTTIDEGDDVTLRWETTNVTNVSINQGIGSVSVDGDIEVEDITRNTTFELTAEGAGQSTSCVVTVRVDEDDDNSGGGSDGTRPYCDLNISDRRVAAGQAVTLSWRTWNIDEIVIEDNKGNVLIDSEDEDDFDGEITIRPTEDLVFSLNAIDGRKDEVCEVEVDVSGEVFVNETRNQPLVAGIALTQVPYTGFEAGPVLTTIFYLLLAAWGLFVAYVIALRKGMLEGVSFAGLTSAPTHTEVEAVEEATAEPVAKEEIAASTTSYAPSNLPTGTAPVIGYAAAAEVDDSLTELENVAHSHKALFSSDAMRHFASKVAAGEQSEKIVEVINDAKSSFPNEDGWVVINLARLESLMGTEEAVVATTAPTTAGSLAEAIVSGNVVAAYEMIAHRPMIALADAAAELDLLLRVRHGAEETVSHMLTTESASLSDEQLRAAIHALTSALDGVYSSEEDAVKMAIMKAVKSVA